MPGDHVRFAYIEHHTQDAVRQLFGEFKGFLRCHASSVYDILDRGLPKTKTTIQEITARQGAKSPAMSTCAH